MLKVEIEGYQSIYSKIKLEISGFTVLVGESNRGKSAAVRAFHAAVSNRRGTDHISVGKSECNVKIEMCGSRVEWKKSSKATSYTIDGEVYHKVGRNPPMGLKKLGILEIVTNDKKRHWPQIQRQMELPFIIGEPSPATTAELLGASEDTIHLTKAIKLAGSDLAKSKTLEGVLEQEIEEDKKKLVDLVPLGESLKGMKQAVMILGEKKKDLESRKYELGLFFNRKKVLSVGREILKPVLDCEVPSVPDMSRLEVLIELNNKLGKLRRLKEIPTPLLFDEDGTPVYQLQRKRVTLKSIQERETTLIMRREALKKAMGLKTPEQLSGDLVSKRRSYYHFKEDLRELSKRKGRVDNELAGLEVRIREAEKQKSHLESHLEGLDYCPLCGNELLLGSSNQN